MPGIVKYEIDANEANGIDTTIDGEDKILPVEVTIDDDVPHDFINGENGLEIASDFLTVSAEVLDTIIEQSLKDFPDEAKKASKFLVKIPLTIASGGLNFISEIELEYDSSGNLSKAIYVATGETIVESSLSSIDLFGSILNWSADKFGAFSRFGIGAGAKFSFIDLYREYSEENVRDFFANGYDSLERFAIDSYDAFIEAGAEILSPAPALEVGADVTAIDDPEYENFKYIKNLASDNEIELIAPYNILEATEDDGNDLVIRSGGLPTKTDAHSIIDGGIGQDTISYAEVILINGIEVNLDLGVSSSLNRNTGLGNGFPIDILDNFENVIGSQSSDYLVGNNIANTIEGMGGGDIIDGGGGEDTAVFSDDFANYDYAIAEDGTITFTHARGTRTDGRDTLTNVELAQFRDRLIPLPLEQPEPITFTYGRCTTKV